MTAELLINRVFHVEFKVIVPEAVVLPEESTANNPDGLLALSPTIKEPLANKLEDVFRFPLTCNELATDELVILIKPAYNVAKPVDCKVDEAWSKPVTVRAAPTEEEAVELKPAYNVAKPVDCKVDEAWSKPDTVRTPLTVEEALEMKPAVCVSSPVTAKVPPTETLFPIVVAASTPVDGSRAIKPTRRRKTSFSLRCIFI